MTNNANSFSFSPLFFANLLERAQLRTTQTESVWCGDLNASYVSLWQQQLKFPISSLPQLTNLTLSLKHAFFFFRLILSCPSNVLVNTSWSKCEGERERERERERTATKKKKRERGIFVDVIETILSEWVSKRLAGWLTEREREREVICSITDSVPPDGMLFTTYSTHSTYVQLKTAIKNAVVASRDVFPHQNGGQAGSIAFPALFLFLAEWEIVGFGVWLLWTVESRLFSSLVDSCVVDISIQIGIVVKSSVRLSAFCALKQQRDF